GSGSKVHGLAATRGTYRGVKHTNAESRARHGLELACQRLRVVVRRIRVGDGHALVNGSRPVGDSTSDCLEVTDLPGAWCNWEVEEPIAIVLAGYLA
ncbi:MAG: hypothetical protein KGR25_10115, partial [Chloroflexi bacterium]|nr:hypothetical protein [Chloroflexota bacterium]